MKNKWRNYALKDGKIQSSYIREYCNRKKVRKTREASNCDSLQQSGKEQPKVEEEVKLVYRPPPIDYQVKVNPIILNDAWVINLRNKDARSDEERPRGNGEGERCVMAMSAIPGEQTGSSGEAGNSQESNEGIQKQEVGSIGIQDESIRKENTSETYQEGRQGIQSSDQRRCEAKERSHEIKNGEKKVKKDTKKHKKHEASESKAYEKKEDKKESKPKKK